MWQVSSTRNRIIAPPEFNRWLVRRARSATHLCIGQAYALSVFNLPLTRQLGVTKSVTGDWRLAELGWIFTIAIVMLGLSAAVFGTWVQREGPRKSGFVAALCWGRASWSVPSEFHPPALAGLPRLRRRRRYRPGDRLHLPGLRPIKWFPDRPDWPPGWRSWGSAAAP